MIKFFNRFFRRRNEGCLVADCDAQRSKVGGPIPPTPPKRRMPFNDEPTPDRKVQEDAGPGFVTGLVMGNLLSEPHSDFHVAEPEPEVFQGGSSGGGGAEGGFESDSGSSFDSGGGGCCGGGE